MGDIWVTPKIKLYQPISWEMIDHLSLMQKQESCFLIHLSNSFLGMITSTDIPTALLILSSTWKNKTAAKRRRFKIQIKKIEIKQPMFHSTSQNCQLAFENAFIYSL